MELNNAAARPSYKIHALLGIALLLVAGTVLWLYFGQGTSQTPYESTDLLMGTYVQQTVYGKNSEQAAEDAAARISELESLISWRVEDSDIYNINRLAGVEYTDIDERTFSLLERCLDVAKQSGGAYDPTIYPLTALWDIGGEDQKVPTAEEIGEFLPYVDYRGLRLKEENRSASLKYKKTALDLGGAGKGAACDEAVAAYQAAGADAAIVSVGGSVGVYGTKEDGSDWKIAIRDPFSEEESISSIGTLHIESGFISTSGTYEKRFTEDGRTYHHILDPTTGYPAESDLVSATVWHDNGAMTDLLSTACIVLGREESLPLLAHYGAQAVLVGADGSLYCTEGIRDRVVLNDAERGLEVLTADGAQ